MRKRFVAVASVLVACATPPSSVPVPAPIAIPSIASASPPPAVAASPEVPEYARPFLPESGASDADVAAAAKEITRRAEDGETVDAAASDALWRCFVAFRPSKAKSINLVRSLHDAVLAVKAPSYGPKAAALLAAPVRDPRDRTEAIDQIQFLQTTAAQLIGALGYADGVQALIKVLLTPEKRDLQFPVRNALVRMPDVSEPLLIAALGDAEAEAPRIADALARISRRPGRDAVLAALENAKNDDNRTALALFLPSFPPDASLVPAFKRAYAKVDPKVSIATFGGSNARALFLGVAAGFFDPSLVPWILKEVATAKGDGADEMMAQGFTSAVRLMTTATSAAVGTAIAAVPGPSLEKDMHKSASAVLTQCKQDPACYVTALDTQVKHGAVKAATMAAVYGNAVTRDALTKKLAAVSDPSIRFVIVMVILHLSPRGDAATAAALEAIVADDQKNGRLSGLDELRASAQQLRARAQ